MKNLIAILLSILGLIWAFYDFNYAHFKTSLQQAQLNLIFLAALILTCSVVIRARRWQWLINVNDSPSIFSLFKLEMIGYFANNVFPLRAGEFYRAFLLKKKYDIKTSYGLGTIALERIFDTLGLILLGLVLIAFYPLPIELKKWMFFASISILLILLVIFIIVKLSKKIDKKESWKGFFLNFSKGLYGFDKDKLFKIFLYTAIIWIIYLIDTFIVQYALNIQLSIIQCLLILVITSMVMSIPSAPGMVGTFHAAVKFTMVEILGYNSDIANTFSIILHAYGFITLTLIGAFYYLKENLDQDI